MSRIRCFFLEPTDQVEMELRRYVGAKEGGPCSAPGGYGYHNADVVVGRGPASACPEFHHGKPVHGDLWPRDDARWPARCACGYDFKPDDEWQFNPHTLYRRSDGGELVTLRKAPPGAMWFAPWFSDSPQYQGPDGNTLIVRCPDGHDWIVDSRASNCTMPQDNVHKCWVRHGTAPDITVDKNGLTCAAGAGSILTPKWHGFLRNGWLEG